MESRKYFKVGDKVYITKIPDKYRNISLIVGMTGTIKYVNSMNNIAVLLDDERYRNLSSSRGYHYFRSDELCLKGDNKMGPWDRNTYIKTDPFQCGETILNGILGTGNKPSTPIGTVNSIATTNDGVTISVDVKKFDKDLSDILTRGYVHYGSLYSKEENVNARNKKGIKGMIKNVIFNDPATIVIWADGSKTVVKAKNEDYDPEKGLAMAIAKKFLGNEGWYYDIFKKWLPEEDDT